MSSFFFAFLHMLNAILVLFVKHIAQHMLKERTRQNVASLSRKKGIWCEIIIINNFWVFTSRFSGGRSRTIKRCFSISEQNGFAKCPSAPDVRAVLIMVLPTTMKWVDSHPKLLHFQSSCHKNILESHFLDSSQLYWARRAIHYQLPLQTIFLESSHSCVVL